MHRGRRGVSFAMRVRFSPASALSTFKSQRTDEDLLVLLVRLIRHPGYSRDAIVSEQLKRYFPTSSSFNVSAEDSLRKQFAKSKLDPKVIEYLSYNADLEIHMAHERAMR